MATIVETAKSLAELAKEVNRIDLHQKAVDLMAQVIELSHENFRLNQELLELKAKQQLHSEIELRDGVYFMPSRAIPGPYCTKCYDTTGKLVLMKDTRTADRDNPSVNVYQCPNCNGYSGRTAVGLTSIRRESVDDLRRERRS